MESKLRMKDRNPRFILVLTPEMMEKIERAVKDGKYCYKADLVRDAIVKRLEALESECGSGCGPDPEPGQKAEA